MVQQQRKLDFRDKERGRAALKAIIEKFDARKPQDDSKPKMSIEERRALLREQARILRERENGR
jgi:hypothetical protein